MQNHLFDSPTYLVVELQPSKEEEKFYYCSYFYEGNDLVIYRIINTSPAILETIKRYPNNSGRLNKIVWESKK